MNPNHHKKRNVKHGQALHVVLSSPYQVFFSPRVRSIVDASLLAYAKHFRIKIYHRALVGTHLHLILLPPDSNSLAGFLRVVSGQIAAKLRRLSIVPRQCKKFWKARPWSRVLTWGRNYSTATEYVALNYLEGCRMVIRNRRVKELVVFRELIERVLMDKRTAL